MRSVKFFSAAMAIGAIAFVSALGARQASDTENTNGVPVSMVVTVEARRSKTIPPLEKEDIAVRLQKKKATVKQFDPLSGSHADMQLLLLIDDSANSNLNVQLGELKEFVRSLPSNIEVGVGYMRNGMSQMVSNFTRDHAAAANSLRVVSGPGGSDVSPYESLSDAIKHWPENKAPRREVIMISSGIEGLGGGYNSSNPYVNGGIQSAQKAGIIVYTIYNPSVGHWGHTFWRETWGQNFLSQLADETGGDSYMIGYNSPVSFQPFLKEILQRFEHQYSLTFLANPQGKAGLQPVNVSVIEKDASIAAAGQVFVPAR